VGRAVAKKKRGPPATGKGQQFAVRVHSRLLPAIDSYIAASDNPQVSRAEAIRRLLAEALGKPAEPARPAIADEAALPEIPKSDAEPYDGSPL
jgi:hypothetical protein